MMRYLVLLGIGGLIGASVGGARPADACERQAGGSEEPSTQEILRRADESRGNLSGVVWTVDIDAVEKGKPQQRSLHVRARGYDFLADFTAPPKTEGNKVLFVQHNMWFARRDVSKPVPISTKQKLVGGASYGDVAATNYADDYEATRLPDEVVDGTTTYAFDLEASTKSATYERIKYWISKDRNVPVKAAYYTVSGKILKEAVFEFDHEVRIGDELRPFVSKMTINDALNKGQTTTLAFSEPTLQELPDSMFNVNLLTSR